jgi:hypothetical protein
MYVSWMDEKGSQGFVERETWEGASDQLYCPPDGEPMRFSEVDDGWGICNTGTQYRIICRKGGIGCNVDHSYVKIRNLEKEIARLVDLVE